MILAKPVIDKRYWILKQDDRKVGEVEADNEGIVVKTQGQQVRYKTMPMARKDANIVFEPAIKTAKPDTHSVHGFATGCRAHNPVWNVQMKIPLFTRQPKSRSWLAAGWYLVKKHRTWQAMRNPK